MQAKFVTAVLLSFVLITASACGGGGSDDGLKDSLAEAEAALEAEKAAREKAEKEASDAAAAAEKAAKAAKDAQEAADKAKADAKKADDAEAARKKAEDDAAAEKKRADDAEAERKRLADEAEKAEQRANAAQAARVYTGLDGTIGSTLAVTPRYREAADITAPAGVRGSSAGATGRWFKTTGSRRTQTTADQVAIYSDVEAPKSVPFKDSEYNPTGTPVVNAQGEVVGEFTLRTSLRADVASGSFDRTSSTPKSFDIVDRGQYTTAQARAEAIRAAQDAYAGDQSDANRDALAAARASKVRNTDRHPYRWSAEAGGTLGGASGRFRCGSAASDENTSCTVQNTGGGFVFTGPWHFVPSSGTVGVRVADANHMWFGWWSRETLPAGTFVFDTNHGGTAPSMTNVTGTATYNGIAVGRYAISGTLVADQSHGEFSANARLTANFGAGSVVGTLTQFSGQPDWEVTLGGGTISTAAVTGGSVTWSIAGDAKDGGAWEADFYSNVPTTDSDGVQPYGIAGTFEAEHGDAARMIGAFGAHR